MSYDLGDAHGLTARRVTGHGGVSYPGIGIVLGAWGASAIADRDGHGVVGGSDLAILLGQWT